MTEPYPGTSYLAGTSRAVRRGRSRLPGVCAAAALSLVWQLPCVFAQQLPAQNQPPSAQQGPPVTGQPTMPPVNRNQLPDNPTPTPSIQNAPTPPAPSTQSAPESMRQEPTGTAAAEGARPAGMAASRPAGAAIAPPKQRQVRSFLIKMGAIAGAGAAIGTVAALSEASPSRVPNTQHIH